MLDPAHELSERPARGCREKQFARTPQRCVSHLDDSVVESRFLAGGFPTHDGHVQVMVRPSRRCVEAAGGVAIRHSAGRRPIHAASRLGLSALLEGEEKGLS